MYTEATRTGLLSVGLGSRLGKAVSSQWACCSRKTPSVGKFPLSLSEQKSKQRNSAVIFCNFNNNLTSYVIAFKCISLNIRRLAYVKIFNEFYHSRDILAPKTHLRLRVTVTCSGK